MTGGRRIDHLLSQRFVVSRQSVLPASSSSARMYDSWSVSTYASVTSLVVKATWLGCSFCNYNIHIQLNSRNAQNTTIRALKNKKSTTFNCKHVPCSTFHNIRLLQKSRNSFIFYIGGVVGELVTWYVRRPITTRRRCWSKQSAQTR